MGTKTKNNYELLFVLGIKFYVKLNNIFLCKMPYHLRESLKKNFKSTKLKKPSVFRLKESLHKSTVTVHVGEVKTNALVDTGTDVSCIHSKMLAKLVLSDIEIILLKSCKLRV